MPRFRLRLQDREIALPDTGEMTVGRDSDCDISLEDRLVSRRHASFRTSPDDLELIDLTSLNGLRVNDVPVKGTVRLGHRDRVQIGAHVFLVLDTRRERGSNAPTAQLSPMRGATRRLARAVLTPLDTISSAIDAGDLAAAAHAMDAVAGRYANPEEPAQSAELARLTTLLLSLTERLSDARFFDRIFQIHTARRQVLDSSAIDVVQDAAARLSFLTAHSLETYLEAMNARAAALTLQDQVRLRRIATVARRLARGAS